MTCLNPLRRIAAGLAERGYVTPWVGPIAFSPARPAGRATGYAKGKRLAKCHGGSRAREDGHTLSYGIASAERAICKTA